MVAKAVPPRYCEYCGGRISRMRTDSPAKYAAKRFCSVDHANKSKQASEAGWKRITIEYFERQVRQSTVAAATPGDCIHHWRIEPPNGRYSNGVCLRCGAVRQFDNAWAEAWENDDYAPGERFRQGFAVLRAAGMRLADE